MGGQAGLAENQLPVGIGVVHIVGRQVHAADGPVERPYRVAQEAAAEAVCGLVPPGPRGIGPVLAEVVAVEGAVGAEHAAAIVGPVAEGPQLVQRTQIVGAHVVLKGAIPEEGRFCLSAVEVAHAAVAHRPVGEVPAGCADAVPLVLERAVGGDVQMRPVCEGRGQGAAVDGACQHLPAVQQSIAEVKIQVAMTLGVHDLRGQEFLCRLRHAEHDALQVIFVPVEPDFRVVAGVVEVVADVVVGVRLLHGVVHHRAEVARGEVLPVVQARPVAVVVDRGDEVAPSPGGEQHVHRLVDLRRVVDGDLLLGEDAVRHRRIPGVDDLPLLIQVVGAVDQIPRVQQPPAQDAHDVDEQQDSESLEYPLDGLLHMQTSDAVLSSMISCFPPYGKRKLHAWFMAASCA